MRAHQNYSQLTHSSICTHESCFEAPDEICGACVFLRSKKLRPYFEAWIASGSINASSCWPRCFVRDSAFGSKEDRNNAVYSQCCCSARPLVLNHGAICRAEQVSFRTHNLHSSTLQQCIVPSSSPVLFAQLAYQPQNYSNHLPCLLRFGRPIKVRVQK